MHWQTRRKIIAEVFGPEKPSRPVAKEPLTAEDWQRLHELRRAYVAGVRQVVCDARIRKANAEFQIQTTKSDS